MSTEFLKSEKSRIINEIIETEEKYISDLKILQNDYGEAIKNLKVLKEKEFKLIFSSKSLIPVNEMFLLEKLRIFWSILKNKKRRVS
jgi:ribosomal protein RSM22 (predicted rRNA methylase)